MIPQSTAQVDPFNLIKHTNLSTQWRQQLKEAYRTPRQLLSALGFSQDEQAQMVCDDHGFMTLVPQAYAQKMRPQDPNDPLLLQVLPQPKEAIEHPDFVQDPLQEADFNPTPGIVHKYKGRALLIAAGHCAINCRYCFRRHYPYNEQKRGRNQWLESLDYIARQ